MFSQVPTKLLKVHPKNREYYSDLPAEKYQEVKKSIETHGIRDPLKILPDYTIVAGHQRLSIAKELGIEKLPVTIMDVTPEEAEYLLIADNEERRQDDADPVKKAKRAKFLKEYWGVRDGSANPKGTVVHREGQNVPDDKKTLLDIAKAVGEDKRNLNRILKLNDLIPSLQELVSSNKLSQTAAYSLAFLTSAEQEILLNTLGESGVCGLSVSEAQNMRKDLEKQKEDYQLVIQELEKELTEIKNQPQLEELSAHVDELHKKLTNEQAEKERIRKESEEKIKKQIEEIKAILLQEQESRIRELDETKKENDLLKTKFHDLCDSYEKERELKDKALEKVKATEEESRQKTERLKAYIETHVNPEIEQKAQITKFQSKLANISTVAKYLTEVDLVLNDSIKSRKEVQDAIFRTKIMLQNWIELLDSMVVDSDNNEIIEIGGESIVLRSN